MDSGSQEESREETLARLETLLRLVPGAWVVVVAEGDLLVRGILKDLGERLAPLKVNEISFIHNEPDPLLLAERFSAENAEAAPVLAFRHLAAVTPRIFLNLDLKREALALLPHRLVFFVSQAERLEMLAKAPNFYSRLRAFFLFASREDKIELFDGDEPSKVPIVLRLAGGRIHRLWPLVNPATEVERVARMRTLTARVEELRKDPAASSALGASLFDLAGLEEVHSAEAALGHYLEAATAFSATGNLAARVDALFCAVSVATLLGKLVSAEEAINQARSTISESSPSLHYEAELPLLEAEMSLRAESPEAEARLREALQSFNELRDAKGTAKSEFLLGAFLLEAGRLQESRESLMSARETYRQLGDVAGIGASNFYLGLVEKNRGNLDHAFDWLQKSIHFFKAPDNIALTYYNLGIVTLELRDYAQALDWFRRALTIYEELADWGSIANTYLQLGFVATKLGGHDQSQDWFRKSVSPVT